MAGLRERQKADCEQRILRGAVACFLKRDYRSVRIEDLAAIAEVSVGSVYNYYATKGDILMATVAMKVEEVLESGHHMLRDPPRGVEPALLALIFTYYDHSLEYLSKEMWRTAMALSIEAPETPSGRRYNELDQKLKAQVIALIRTLQERGEIVADVDAEPLGRLVFSNMNMMFMDFVKDGAMTLEELRGQVTEQTRPLARMMATEQRA